MIGTCDWGWCEGLSIAWRWHHDLQRWLPVCEYHSAAYVLAA